MPAPTDSRSEGRDPFTSNHLVDVFTTAAKKGGTQRRKGSSLSSSSSSSSASSSLGNRREGGTRRGQSFVFNNTDGQDHEEVNISIVSTTLTTSPKQKRWNNTSADAGAVSDVTFFRGQGHESRAKNRHIGRRDKASKQSDDGDDSSGSNSSSRSAPRRVNDDDFDDDERRTRRRSSFSHRVVSPRGGSLDLKKSSNQSTYQREHQHQREEYATSSITDARRHRSASAEDSGVESAPCNALGERVNILVLEKEALIRQLKLSEDEKKKLAQRHDAAMGAAIVSADEERRGLVARIDNLTEMLEKAQSDALNARQEVTEVRERHASTAAHTYALVQKERGESEATMLHANAQTELITEALRSKALTIADAAGHWLNLSHFLAAERSFLLTGLLGGESERDVRSRGDRRGDDEGSTIAINPSFSTSFVASRDALIAQLMSEREAILVAAFRQEQLYASRSVFSNSRAQMYVMSLTTVEKNESDARNLLRCAFDETHQLLLQSLSDGVQLLSTSNFSHSSLVARFEQSLTSLSSQHNLAMDGLLKQHASDLEHYESGLATARLVSVLEGDALARAVSLAHEEKEAFLAHVRNSLITPLVKCERAARDDSEAARRRHASGMEEKSATIDALRERIAVLTEAMSAPPPPPQIIHVEVPPKIIYQLPEGAVTAEELHVRIEDERKALRQAFESELSATLQRQREEDDEKLRSVLDSRRREVQALISEKDSHILELEHELAEERERCEEILTDAEHRLIDSEARAVDALNTLRRSHQQELEKERSDAVAKTLSPLGLRLLGALEDAEGMSRNTLVQLEADVYADHLSLHASSALNALLEKLAADGERKAAEHRSSQLKIEVLKLSNALEEMTGEWSSRVTRKCDEHKRQTESARRDFESHLDEMSALHESEIGAAVSEIAAFREKLSAALSDVDSLKARLLSTEEHLLAEKGRVHAVESELSQLRLDMKKQQEKHLAAAEVSKMASEALRRQLETEFSERVAEMAKGKATDLDLLRASFVLEMDTIRREAESAHDRLIDAEGDHRRELIRISEEHNEAVDTLTLQHESEINNALREIMRLRLRVRELEEEVKIARTHDGNRKAPAAVAADGNADALSLLSPLLVIRGESEEQQESATERFTTPPRSSSAKTTVTDSLQMGPSADQSQQASLTLPKQKTLGTISEISGCGRMQSPSTEDIRDRRPRVLISSSEDVTDSDRLRSELREARLEAKLANERLRSCLDALYELEGMVEGMQLRERRITRERQGHVAGNLVDSFTTHTSDSIDTSRVEKERLSISRGSVPPGRALKDDSADRLVSVLAEAIQRALDIGISPNPPTAVEGGDKEGGKGKGNDATRVAYWRSQCEKLEDELEELRIQHREALIQRDEELARRGASSVGPFAPSSSAVVVADSKGIVGGMRSPTPPPLPLPTPLIHQTTPPPIVGSTTCQRCEQLKTTLAVLEATHAEAVQRLEAKLIKMKREVIVTMSSSAAEGRPGGAERTLTRPIDEGLTRRNSRVLDDGDDDDGVVTSYADGFDENDEGVGAAVRRGRKSGGDSMSQRTPDGGDSAVGGGRERRSPFTADGVYHHRLISTPTRAERERRDAEDSYLRASAPPPLSQPLKGINATPPRTNYTKHVYVQQTFAGQEGNNRSASPSFGHSGTHVSAFASSSLLPIPPNPLREALMRERDEQLRTQLRQREADIHETLKLTGTIAATVHERSRFGFGGKTRDERTDDGEHGPSGKKEGMNEATDRPSRQRLSSRQGVYDAFAAAADVLSGSSRSSDNQNLKKSSTTDKGVQIPLNASSDSHSLKSRPSAPSVASTVFLAASSSGVNIVASASSLSPAAASASGRTGNDTDNNGNDNDNNPRVVPKLTRSVAEVDQQTLRSATKQLDSTENDRRNSHHVRAATDAATRIHQRGNACLSPLVRAEQHDMHGGVGLHVPVTQRWNPSVSPPRSGVGRTDGDHDAHHGGKSFAHRGRIREAAVGRDTLVTNAAEVNSSDTMTSRNSTWYPVSDSTVRKYPEEFLKSIHSR